VHFYQSLFEPNTGKAGSTAAAQCPNAAGAACNRLNAQYYTCVANSMQFGYRGPACGNGPSCSTACTGGASSSALGSALLGGAGTSSGNPKVDAFGKVFSFGIQMMMNNDSNNSPPQRAAPDPAAVAAQAVAAAAAAQQNANAQAAQTLQEANSLMASMNGSSTTSAPDSTAALNALLGGGAAGSPANGDATSTIVGLLGQADDGGTSADLSQALRNAQQTVIMENYGPIPAPPAEIDFPQTSADATQMYTPGVQDNTSGWASEQNPALSALYKDAPPIQVVTYEPDGTIDVKSYPQTFQSEITFPSPGTSPIAAPSPSVAQSVTPSVAPPVPASVTPASPTSSVPVPIGNTTYATPTAASAPQGQPAQADSDSPADSGSSLFSLRQKANEIKQQLMSPIHTVWNAAMEAKRAVSLCDFANTCGDSK
jgi:hypothetical protein